MLRLTLLLSVTLPAFGLSAHAMDPCEWAVQNPQAFYRSFGSKTYDGQLADVMALAKGAGEDVSSEKSLSAMTVLIEALRHEELKRGLIVQGVEALFGILSRPTQKPETYRFQIAQSLGAVLKRPDLTKDEVITCINRMCAIYIPEVESNVKRGILESLYTIAVERNDPSAIYAQGALDAIGHRERDPGLSSTSRALADSIEGTRLARKLHPLLNSGREVVAADVVKPVVDAIVAPYRGSDLLAKKRAILTLDALVNELHTKGWGSNGAPLKMFILALMIGKDSRLGDEKPFDTVHQIVEADLLTEVPTRAWNQAVESVAASAAAANNKIKEVPNLYGVVRPLEEVATNPSLRDVAHQATWSIPYLAALRPLGDELVWEAHAAPNNFLTAQGRWSQAVGDIEVTIFETAQETEHFLQPVQMFVDIFMPASKLDLGKEVSVEMGRRIRQKLGLDENTKFATRPWTTPVPSGKHAGLYRLRLYPSVIVRPAQEGRYSTSNLCPGGNQRLGIIIESYLRNFVEAAQASPLR